MARGRPKGARAAAVAQGSKTYIADNPHKCGTRVRYTHNASCVYCDKNRRDWNDEAFRTQHATRQRAYRERVKAAAKMVSKSSDPGKAESSEFGDILG
ncbi:hypothetical protein Sinme_1425 [Sinorhizobium meliloti AK83]|nr:hypothetical protein Sinme_1425 [Sinorhizobium meliloti AK83]SEI56482.1 hypothetical protein SAMN04244575_01074 [Sinorhizobium meliloti]